MESSTKKVSQDDDPASNQWDMVTNPGLLAKDTEGQSPTENVSHVNVEPEKEIAIQVNLEPHKQLSEQMTETTN